MKKIFIKTFIILGIWTLAGCQKFLDVNVDPTRPNDASMATLLPSTIYGTAQFNYSTAYAVCQYAQQTGGGIDGQTPTTIDGGWTTLYLNIVPNLNIIVQKGQDTKSPAYVGIAKVLLAMNMALATDMWENVPYSQADQAEKGTFKPAYDSQESIYTEVTKLLNDGIAALKDPGNEFSQKPGADDLAYNGNLSRWIKLANTLKARYALHLVKKGSAKAATDALAALAGGMTDNADDFQLVYVSGFLNPWNQVALANYTGNLSIAQGFQYISLLNGTLYPTADPRLSLVAGSLKTGFVYKTPQEYIGTRPGSGALKTVDFTRTTFHTTANAPLIMVSYAETKLLEAEARFLANGGTKTSKGSTAEAYSAYLAAMRANMTKTGVSAADITTYQNAKDVGVGASALSLENIMTEKYKVLFLNAEVWNDLRRYDQDATVFKGLALPDPQYQDAETKGKWIQRARYPTSETARNQENSSVNAKTLDQVMWLFK